MACAAPILKRQARLMKRHGTLKADVESIESSVRSMVPSDLEYDFKVELWLRGVAPHEGDANYLVKLVDSMGISLDPKMRRNDFYQHRFPVRSSGLRVLQLGQAELANLRKLGLSITTHLGGRASIRCRCRRASWWMAYRGLFSVTWVR